MIAPSLVVNSGRGIICPLEAIIITKCLQNIRWFTTHVFGIYVFFFSLKYDTKE